MSAAVSLAIPLAASLVHVARGKVDDAEAAWALALRDDAAHARLVMAREFYRIALEQFFDETERAAGRPSIGARRVTR